MFGRAAITLGIGPQSSFLHSFAAREPAVTFVISWKRNAVFVCLMTAFFRFPVCIRHFGVLKRFCTTGWFFTVCAFKPGVTVVQSDAYM